MFGPKITFVPPVIAHRGARSRAPENTMPAFKAAREDGAIWIETDVKLTADGVPVLIHDETLERTTDGAGAVSGMTWDDMQKLDAGKWFGAAFAGTRIPMLAELLVFVRDAGMRLNLELKPCPGRTQATAMVALIEVAKYWPEEAPPPLVSSFDIEALTVASQLHPDWPRGLLLDTWREDWREVIALTQAATLNVNADLLTPERLTMLRDAQIPTLAYTVNDPARAKALLQNGVRAVFSDNAGPMLDALKG